MLLCGCSVGDIDDAATFGDPNTIPSDDEAPATSGAVLTTGVSEDPTDPTGDAGSETASASATSGSDPDSDTDTEGPSSESSSGPVSGGSTGMSAECGNGVVEADEACDGDDLMDMTCGDIGTFVDGALACGVDCEFDTTACVGRSQGPVEVCETISLAIPDSGSAVTSTVTLPAGGTIADATIGVALTHTFIGDLTVDVEHGGTTVRVYNRECSTEDNMDLVFDDAGVAVNCAASVSGAATLPSEALSGFEGLDPSGAWTFSFQDNALLDEGSATEICVGVTF